MTMIQQHIQHADAAIEIMNDGVVKFKAAFDELVHACDLASQSVRALTTEVEALVEGHEDEMRHALGID